MRMQRTRTNHLARCVEMSCLLPVIWGEMSIDVSVTSFILQLKGDQNRSIINCLFGMQLNC